MDEELKPCPFCGGAAKAHIECRGGGRCEIFVACRKCSARIPDEAAMIDDFEDGIYNFIEALKRAAAAWNMRQPGAEDSPAEKAHGSPEEGAEAPGENDGIPGQGSPDAGETPQDGQDATETPQGSPGKHPGGAPPKTDYGKITALHKAGWDTRKIADEMRMTVAQASKAIYYAKKKMAEGFVWDGSHWVLSSELL